MYTEKTQRPLNRRDYEARARYERSAVFHAGLARIMRVFHPSSEKL